PCRHLCGEEVHVRAGTKAPSASGQHCHAHRGITIQVAEGIRHLRTHHRCPRIQPLRAIERNHADTIVLLEDDRFVTHEVSPACLVFSGWSSYSIGGMLQQRFACDSLVALANSTTDQSVLFAKNSDRPHNECQPLLQRPRRSYSPDSRLRCTYIEVPQAAETA